MFFSAFLGFGKLGSLFRQNAEPAPAGASLYTDDSVTALVEDDGVTPLLEG